MPKVLTVSMAISSSWSCSYVMMSMDSTHIAWARPDLKNLCVAPESPTTMVLSSLSEASTSTAALHYEVVDFIKPALGKLEG